MNSFADLVGRTRCLTAAVTSAAFLAATLVGSAQTVAAQGWSPETCAAERDIRDYILANPDIFGGPAGKLQLATINKNLQNLCDDVARELPPAEPPNPARAEAPADASPVAVAPAVSPPADDGPDNRVETDRSACVLLRDTEVGAAMKQSVSANAADPFGVTGAQGCEFDGTDAAHTNVIYVQANGAFFYDSFRSTAEPNGVQPVSGLGDRAFTYSGGNGPGVVVAKGDKLFALEFSGIGSGPAQDSSLLLLAEQAVARVK